MSVDRNRCTRPVSHLLAMLCVLLLAACTLTTIADRTTARAEAPRIDTLDAQLDALEARYATRIGVAALNTATGARYSHRGDERFALCSTFKTYAVAAVLRRTQNGTSSLDSSVVVQPGDLVVNSPVTSAAVGSAMTLRQIAEAAMTRSDNTAGNYLLAEIGGPSAVTALARDVGDETTRLDRYEPELNSALRGDLRDTSTPDGLAEGYRNLLLGDVLPPPLRDQLVNWMRANQTSDTRMRAGLPPGWTVADKTGAGDFGTSNNAGVVWSPAGEPIVLTILTDSSTGRADAPADDRAIADTAAAVIAALND